MDPTPASPDPYRPENIKPAPAVGSCDPFAAALANASLLGAGYAMLERVGLAIGTVSAAVVLVAVPALVKQLAWLQVVVFLLWVAVTAHAWYLAGGRLRRTGPPPSAPRSSLPATDVGAVRRQRFIALGVAVPVLLAFAFLRVDGWGIDRKAADAHRANECGRTLSILDRMWVGHRLADAPLVARTDERAEACQLLVRAQLQASDSRRVAAARTLQAYRAHPGALWEGAGAWQADLLLDQAADDLDDALTGDTQALRTGFDHLSTVLDESPGRRRQVGDILDAFLADLPVKNDCDTKAITDWLGNRPANGNELDRVAKVVARVAPAAIVGCGDDLMDDDELRQARETYQQLLDQYPDHELADKAKRGAELANVTILLDRPGSGGKPRYCKDPAPYSGADPYRGNGPHPALLYGNTGHKKKLPSSWKADDPDDAVLVICIGDTKYGSTVETCQYEAGTGISRGIHTVRFRARKVPLRVYEVRTGDLVTDRSIEILGDSCPYVIQYTYSIDIGDPGPPSQKYVDSSKADVRDAYRPLINP